MRYVLLFAALLGAALAAPAHAGPNVPFCLAMERNYSECVRREQARAAHREEEREWRREEVARGDMDPEEWERMRHRHHDEDQGDACAPMLVELKANGCF